MDITLLFETVMLILFGISWPLNILKSIQTKTAKGKSILFLIFVWVGYVFGALSKFISGNITYVVWFYIINLVMVSIDIVLYFFNKHRDKIYLNVQTDDKKDTNYIL